MSNGLVFGEHSGKHVQVLGTRAITTMKYGVYQGQLRARAGMPALRPRRSAVPVQWPVSIVAHSVYLLYVFTCTLVVSITNDTCIGPRHLEVTFVKLKHSATALLSWLAMAMSYLPVLGVCGCWCTPSD